MKKHIHKIKLLLLLLIIVSCDKDSEVITSYDFEIEKTYEEISTINLGQKTTFNIETTPVTTVKYNFKYEVISGEGKYFDIDNNPIPEGEFVELSGLNFDYFYTGTTISKDKVKVTIVDSDEREKEAELIYDVQHNDFTLEASSPVSTINVNEIRPISINIENTGKDDSVTYERAFFIIQGTATILNADESEELEEEVFVPIDEGVFSYNLKFSETGDSKFKVITRDSNGQEKEDILEFSVEVIDFSFTAASDQNTVFLGNEFNYNFVLSEDQGSGGSYKMRYTVDEGSISISSGGTPVSPGTLVDVSLGNFSWQASSTIEQTVKVTFFVRNDTGVEIPRTVSVNISGGSFSFDAVPTALQGNVNDIIDINAIITENGPTGAPYSLVYTSTGTGSLDYNGTSYSPGQVISGITDLTFALKYKGVSEGNHKLVFTLTNANGVPVEDDETIDFENTNFTFTAESVAPTAFVNECTNINLRIDGPSSITYSMVFTASVSGTFTLNGQSYTTNTPIVVSPGSFTGCFTATTGGTSDLEFTVTGSNNIVKKSDVDLTIQEFSYTLDIPETVTVIAGNRGNFSFNYSASNTNVDAKLFYTIDDTNGKVRRQDDNSVLTSPYTLPQGTTNLYLDYPQTKSYTITWTYINNLGFDVTYTTVVTVNNLPYSLGIAASSEEIYDDQTVDLSLSVNANAATQNYKLVSYTLNSGSGTLKYNGTNVGSNFNLPSATTTFTFEPSSDADLNIKFTVEDDFGQRKEISKTVSIKNSLGEWSTTGSVYLRTREDPRTGRLTYFYYYEVKASVIDPGSGSGFSRMEVYDLNGNRLLERTGSGPWATTSSLQLICSVFNNSNPCYTSANTPPITYRVRLLNSNGWTDFKTVVVDP